jgi:predicted Zn finger-like uncharacterized protein
MIVTCPNCCCQFKVSTAVFGREGRNVKCSACQEIWWQEPTLEDVTEEIVENPPQDIFKSEQDEDVLEEDLDDEDLLDDVTEEEFALNMQERVDEYRSMEGVLIANYMAGGLFVLLLLLLWLMSSSILKSYPSMHGFYRFIGAGLEVPDTMSVMFEGVKAEREGALVTASGRIVNLSRKEWTLPMIEVVVFRPIVDDKGEGAEEIIAQWVEKPPVHDIEAEKEVPFSYSRHVSLDKSVVSHSPHEEEGSDDHGAGDAHATEGHGEDEHGGDTSAHGLAEEKHKSEDMYMVRVHFVVMPQQQDAEEENGHGADVSESHGNDHGNNEDSHSGHEEESSHKTHNAEH